MGGRHEARQWAVQFLFQRDFNSGDIESDLAEFWQDKKSGDKTIKLMNPKATLAKFAPKP